jgi:hypothetical protein
LLPGWAGCYLDVLAVTWMGWLLPGWAGCYLDGQVVTWMGWQLPGWAGSYLDGLAVTWMGWLLPGWAGRNLRRQLGGGRTPRRRQRVVQPPAMDNLGRADNWLFTFMLVCW